MKKLRIKELCVSDKVVCVCERAVCSRIAVACDNVVCDKERTAEAGRRTEVRNKKQEPHTKMWENSSVNLTGKRSTGRIGNFRVAEKKGDGRGTCVGKLEADPSHHKIIATTVQRKYHAVIAKKHRHAGSKLSRLLSP